VARVVVFGMGTLSVRARLKFAVLFDRVRSHVFKCAGVIVFEFPLDSVLPRLPIALALLVVALRLIVRFVGRRSPIRIGLLVLFGIGRIADGPSVVFVDHVVVFQLFVIFFLGIDARHSLPHRSNNELLVIQG
jgi:hypothetical protein